MDEPGSIRDLAQELVTICVERGLMVATAESCTGGLVAGAITDVPGSSAVLDRGFVTYSNEAKEEMLGVPQANFAANGPGAVSEETASAMAEGALDRSNATIAVAITGIAGPGGGSEFKPVGLVWFGCAVSGGSTFALSMQFPDEGRDAIRMMAVETALRILIDTASAETPAGNA